MVYELMRLGEPTIWSLPSLGMLYSDREEANGTEQQVGKAPLQGFSEEAEDNKIKHEIRIYLALVV